MPRSCSDRRRAASAANAGFILVLLQRVAHALGVGEGCTASASYPEVRSDHHHANSFRTATAMPASPTSTKSGASRPPRLAGLSFSRALVVSALALAGRESGRPR